MCGPIFVPVVTNSHATFLPGGKAANQRFFAEHGGWWLGGEAGGLSQCEERGVIDCYTPIVMLPGRTTATPIPDTTSYLLYIHSCFHMKLPKLIEAKLYDFCFYHL